MRRYPLLATALALISLAAGCAREPSTPQPRPAPVAEFREFLARQGKVTFLSWNGKWIGTDCDTDITFMSDGAVEMTEYGCGIQSYPGTWQIDSSGVVSLQLARYKPGWPAMLLDKDATSFLLRPSQARQGFVMGNRAGATIPGGAGSYWPFRIVDRKPFDPPPTRPSTSPSAG